MSNTSLAITNYGLTFITVAIMALYVHTTLNVRTGKKTTLLFVLTLGFLNGTVVAALMFTHLDVIRPLLVLVLSAVFIKLFFSVSIWKSLLSTLLFFMLTMLGELLATLSLTMIHPGDIWGESSVSVLIYANIIVYIVDAFALLVIRQYKLISMLPGNVKGKHYITSTVLIISMFIILAVNMTFYSTLGRTDASGISMLLFTLVILMLFISVHLSIRSKLEQTNQEYEYQKFYNQTLESVVNELRRYKHNHNNIMATLVSLVNARQYSELNQFLQDGMSESEKSELINQTMLLNIKNAGILGLLSYKMECGKKSGIQLNIQVLDEVREVRMMKINDLCETLGILIDNAIEAASLSEDKIVRIQIKNAGEESDTGLSFLIENSCKETPDIHNMSRLGYSTKGEGRGWGLWFLQNKILKKYPNVYLHTSLTGQGLLRQKLSIVNKKAGRLTA